MPGEQYKGKLEHIMEVCAKAGFSGIEPETSFLEHLEDPERMKEALAQWGLDLAVLCVVEDWLNPTETSEERERGDKWINLLSHFPDTILLPVQMPQNDRSNLKERQQNLLSCVNAFMCLFFSSPSPVIKCILHCGLYRVSVLIQLTKCFVHDTTAVAAG